MAEGNGQVLVDNSDAFQFSPLPSAQANMENLWRSRMRTDLATAIRTVLFSDGKNWSGILEHEGYSDSNISENYDDDGYSDYEDLIRIQWWIGVLELIVFTVGTPANIAVLCLALLKKKQSGVDVGRKRNTTTFLVSSMTCADLLFCLLHAPMMFLSYTMEVNYSQAPCLLLFGVTHLSTVASSLSLLLVNIDKFLHIRQPLHYGVYVTTQRGVSCIVLCWLISIVWSLLFVFSPFTVYDETCNVRLTRKGVYISFAVGFFVIPTLVSLAISAYVAVVVFEARFGIKRLGHDGKEGHQLQTDLHSGYSSVNANGSIHRRTSNANLKKIATFNSVHTAGAPSRLNVLAGLDRKESNFRKITSSSYLSAPAASGSTNSSVMRSSSLRSDFAPVLSLRRSASLRSRQRSQFRRISFVFTTTIWSTFTVLPYRLVFIVWNVATYDVPLEHLALINRIAERVYFCLFALMALNAAGNPFITIITQRQYCVKLAGLWERLRQQNGLSRLWTKRSWDFAPGRTIDERSSGEKCQQSL